MPEVPHTARAHALRRLSRRPLTEGELRRQLVRWPQAEVDTVLGELRRRGWLDDRRLAVEFCVSRAQRLGHGRRRLLSDLARRGVDAEVAESAWREAVAEGRIDTEQVAVRRVRRRLGLDGSPVEKRAFFNVYTSLRRDGFDEADIHTALDPYREHVIDRRTRGADFSEFDEERP